MSLHLSRLIAPRVAPFSATLGDTQKCCMYAVLDARCQLVGPLADRLVGDTNRLGGGRDASSEHFNGLGLTHAPLNHSSRLSATLVQRTAAVSVSMDDYQDRICAALGDLVEDKRILRELAKLMGITYQGLVKLVEGKSKMPGAAANSAAAKFLKVDSDWLATGEGSMHSSRVWPFETLSAAQFARIPAEVRAAAERMLLSSVPSSNERMVVGNIPTKSQALLSDDSYTAGVDSTAPGDQESRSWISESLIGKKTTTTQAPKAGGRLLNPSPKKKPAKPKDSFR